MIPVKQTKFGGEDGDCLPACVASILELDLADVPNFCAGQDDGRWLGRMAFWLSRRGLCAVHTAFVDSDPGTTPAPEDMGFAQRWCRTRRVGWAIVNGYTARGLSHSTVWFEGEPVHDPHPEPTPLLNVVSIIVIAQRDPSGLPDRAREAAARTPDGGTPPLVEGLPSECQGPALKANARGELTCSVQMRVRHGCWEVESGE